MATTDQCPACGGILGHCVCGQINLTNETIVMSDRDEVTRLRARLSASETECERLADHLESMTKKRTVLRERATAAESALADLRDRVEVIARASEKAFVSNRKKNPDYVYTGLEADMAMVDAELALLRALLAKGGE